MCSKLFKIILALAIVAQASCNSSGGGKKFPLPENFDADAPYTVSITGADLSQVVDNTFFPAPPGATWSYQGETEDGTELINVAVLSAADMNGSKVVMGFDARVIRDTVFLDGELVEDTWDWYGQDAAGNVWYIGEDTAEYENGMIVCNCGAWEWGVDGALPGYQMLASPQVGDAYRRAKAMPRKHARPGLRGTPLAAVDYSPWKRVVAEQKNTSPVDRHRHHGAGRRARRHAVDRRVLR
jgi:hypothetical protein